MLSAAMVERVLAFVGALIVGGTALVQLRNELPGHGLAAGVSKLLLGLMIIDCVFALLASINIMGAFG